MKVGIPPILHGVIELKCPEMMFIQDMPVIMPGLADLRLPPNLEFCRKLFDVIKYSPKDYVYISCKSMFVNKHSRGRPGWHLDGFGTDDINYIWSDNFPTEFCVQEFDIEDDHVMSRIGLEQQAKEENIITYPDKTFAEMDANVVHRVSTDEREGFRTFIKITVSKHIFNLAGNAHNHLFGYEWDMIPRTLDRNRPAKV